MAKQGLLQQLFYYSICLVAFFIPFPFIYGSIAVITTTVLWLLQGNFKQTFTNLRERKIFWAILIFFLLHAISYFYSTNKGESLTDLQLKLLFVALPITIGAGADINKLWLTRIVTFFVAGITAIAIFCFADAIILWTEQHITWQFFYHQLVRKLSANAVYMSWYVVFSLSCLLYYPWPKQGKGRVILLVFTILLQLLFLFLLSSRTLILLFVGITIISLLANRFKTSIGEKVLYIALLTSILFVVFTDNPIKRRYTEVATTTNSEVRPVKSTDTLPPTANTIAEKTTPPKLKNVGLRVFIWKAGFQNMNEHHLWLTGAGNGDVHLLQNQKLYENGITDMFDAENRSEFYNINLHNMYFQSLFMLGIPGLILFLIITFSPVITFFRNKCVKIFIFFNIISIIFMLQESVLQTQAGMLYYVFFWVIFWNTHYNKSEFSAS